MEKSYQDLLTSFCKQAEEVVSVKCKLSVEPFSDGNKMILRIIRNDDTRVYSKQVFEEKATSYREALEDAARRVLLDVFIEGCFSRDSVVAGTQEDC